MQHATCTKIRVRSPSNARVIFHGVVLDILPMVTRRLDTEERSLISPGHVYVWEERGPHAELTGVFDGGRRESERVSYSTMRNKNQVTSIQTACTTCHSACCWPPSHSPPFSPSSDYSRTILIKQTYTVFVDTPRGQRKWHLIAYFTEESLDRLRSIEDIPELASLRVPHGKYKSARSAKGRPDHIFNPESESREFSRLEYVPYTPNPRSASDNPEPPATNRPSTWIDLPLRDHKGSTKSGSASSASDDNPNRLAPLTYLENIPPPRRHPMDEKALMLFQAYGLWV
ncbi:uncharacterized protein LACBIDRAFT_310627 [Laccaria bicolor S238N-H82]|uniref:Predicted protein n=1 Tax=Laccaria bicolor (strain S238N-H82 / ATCC MYA-4686) TaxID=486041 RepID=B0DUR5_LACBS|nr:uncharacterized protein LACBIDRAFT_310627 [Laccaria bicolor S238N-H82]EDR01590.1 predicted protein [Laccaria bicolor S238N-H82]|eukprot:XP_001887666.1 predicted protein [Laccaria bicolor S238N-H82]